MTIQRSQIPLHFSIVGPDGKMNQQWAFWFQQFVQSLPPSGSGYVVDGSATTYGPTTIYQGPDINKGNSPNLGDVYIATDTGKIYIEQSGSWVLELPSFSGDVTSNVNSNVLSLANVNFAPGTYGNSTEIPIVSVDSKGRVTSVTTTPITTPTPLAEGPNLSIQFNFANNLSGSGNLTFNPFNNTLSTGNISVGNMVVGGNISFFNPTQTFNNLSPLTTKGDLLTHTGNTNARQPVGLDGQVLVANSSSATGLSWAPNYSNIADAQTPYYIPNNQMFTVYDYKQVLWFRPITVDGLLVVDGDLIQVP